MRYEIVKQYGYYYVYKVYKAKKWWLFGDIVEKRSHMSFNYTNGYYTKFKSAESAEQYLKVEIDYNNKKLVKVIEVE
jgi:hypothetical protein